MATLAEFRETTSDGSLPAYVWPGGYPMFYITRDGMTVCPACANRETDDSQAVIAGDIYWEGPTLICEDQGESIESAYGDPAADWLDSHDGATAEDPGYFTDDPCWCTRGFAPSDGPDDRLSREHQRGSAGCLRAE